MKSSFAFVLFAQFWSLYHAQLPFGVNEDGDIRHPLNKLDIPFVPEEFRSSPKRIIFDKNDFVALLPSEDLEQPLREATLNILISTFSNDTRVRAF